MALAMPHEPRGWPRQNFEAASACRRTVRAAGDEPISPIVRRRGGATANNHPSARHGMIRVTCSLSRTRRVSAYAPLSLISIIFTWCGVVEGLGGKFRSNGQERVRHPK